MAVTPSSKSQDRLMALVNLECDGSYDMAARVLDAAGLPKDGLPSGHTWRTAGKLSDAELLALLPTPRTITKPIATAAQALGERVAAWQAREERRRERVRLNDQLRALGYRWIKVGVPNQSPLMDDWDERWALTAPDGREVTVPEALAEIAR